VRRRAHLRGVGPAHSQKSAIKPWLKGQWSIPPKQDASFVWRMEDILEVYTRPYEERFPQVCLEEKSKQLVSYLRIAVSISRRFAPNGCCKCHSRLRALPVCVH
jgi:hypothetical protein